MSDAITKDWFGQPRGLTILFLTEMWEKFSFYGMRALLVFYMVQELGFTAAKASVVYGAYTAFVYFTPLFGGLIADRYLGRRRSVIWGGLIMALGHLLMSFPSLFYPALVIIAIGNGLFLPNLPSQINPLYKKDDPRRASAFNIYYMGVNLGAFLAPFICGTLGETLGWHYGFSAAGIGMVIGLCIYTMGQKFLIQEDASKLYPTPDEAEPTASSFSARVSMFLLLIISVVIFRGAYEQMGNTIALWTYEDINRMVGGFVIPATWFQSLNPLLIFLLTPTIVSLWTRMSRRKTEPAAPVKMALGALGLALAFVGIAIAAWIGHGEDQKISLWVLVSFITVLTFAELMILPVGLDLFSRLSARSFRATTIAIWFSAAFLGNLLAGYLGSFWDQLDRPYFFLLLAMTAATAFMCLACINIPMRRIFPDVYGAETSTEEPASKEADN